MHIRRRQRSLTRAKIPFVILSVIFTLIAPISATVMPYLLMTYASFNTAVAVIVGIVMMLLCFAVSFISAQKVAICEREILAFGGILEEQRRIDGFYIRHVDSDDLD